MAAMGDELDLQGQDPQEFVAQVYRVAGFEVERRVGAEPGAVAWFAIAATGFPRTRTFFRVLPTVPADLERELSELTAICLATGADRAIGIVWQGELPEDYEPDLATANSSALFTFRQWFLEVAGIADRTRKSVRETAPAAAGLYLPRRARLDSGEEVDVDAFIERWAESPDVPTLLLMGAGRRTTAQHAAWSAARRFTERPNAVTPFIWSYVRPIHVPFAVVVADARLCDLPPPARSLLVWSRASRKELLTTPGVLVLSLLPPGADDIERWFERHLQSRVSFERLSAARKANKDFAEISNDVRNLQVLLSSLLEKRSSTQEDAPIDAWIAVVVDGYIACIEADVVQQSMGELPSSEVLERIALEQFALGKAALKPIYDRHVIDWMDYGWLEPKTDAFVNDLIMHYFLARKIAREVRAGHEDILVRYQFPHQVFLFLTTLAPDIAARLTSGAAAGLEKKIREEAERIAQLGFAHRLNRPVGAMRQHLDEIRETLDKDQKNALARPFARLEEEIDYIERLAEKTRIWESGPASTEPSSVALRPCVEDEIAALARKHAGVDAAVDIPDDLHVVAIPDALRETLHCLLENAFHAVACSSRSNSNKIIVAGSRIGGVIRIEIRDSGDGVNPDDRERIFEPFRTNKTGGAGKPRGTGLGLAIAKRFVDVMGGRIGLDPTQEDTCFFVELVAGKAEV